jgi:hypothetical protein
MILDDVTGIWNVGDWNAASGVFSSAFRESDFTLVFIGGTLRTASPTKYRQICRVYPFFLYRTHVNLNNQDIKKS